MFHPMDFSNITAAWHASMTGSDAGQAALCIAQGEPVRHLCANTLGEVGEVVLQAAQWAARGHWVVGGLQYEAAPAFDPNLCVNAGVGQGPLAVFSVYTPAQVNERTLAELLLAAQHPWHIDPWVDDLPLGAYRRGFSAIQAAIEAGEFYQINFTTRLRSTASSIHPWYLFLHFFKAQPAEQSVYLQMPMCSVLSWSPELFFSWKGRTLRTSPMKGTRPLQKESYGSALSDSEKDRAENVMIVDLLRNDMAKICEPNSVQVQSLFDVMRLSTVEQMTSTIVGQTRSNIDLLDVFAALFPCGSVTGAPKSQAMKRIAQWEQTPRRFYCGALGVLSPQGDAHFNVPIRTAVVDASHGHHAIEYGVGSGITWYSDVQAEKREWWQKTAFLRQASVDFQVLETVLLRDGRWERQSLHLARMARSADLFSYVWDESEVICGLQGVALGNPVGEFRGRWLLHADGRFEVTLHDKPAVLEPVRLQLAPHPMVADPRFVLNKTTHRPHYDDMLPTAQELFDTLLVAANGLLTETCRGNLVIQRGNVLLTPALNENEGVVLLPGVMRELLLRENTLQEAQLTVQDLRQAHAVWLINSLRGWVPVAQVVDSQGAVVFQSKP
ncbi:MAG TPA: chorismate-binding protein [Limnobacter sp.]|nr:chorismate-binding protein [Limnobacter sp.]